MKQHDKQRPQPPAPPRAHTMDGGYMPVATTVHVEERTPRVILYDQHGVALAEPPRPIGFKP
jgi:hypothetical protein